MKTKYYSLSIVLLLFTSSAFSQTTFSLTASQSYNNDYQSGERNSFDICANINGKNKIEIKPILLFVNYKLAVGILYEKSDKFENKRVRPTDNELFYELIAKYPLGWKIDPYISFNLRTSITEAMRYSNNKKIKSAKFWDPVNTQEAFGLAYNVNYKDFKYEIRSGISLLQIRANKYTATTDDPLTRDIKERYKTKTGVDFVNTLFYQIDASASISSCLSMFGDCDDLTKWTARSENELKVILIKSFGIICKFNILYDEKQMKKTQYQQSLRIGLVFNVL